MAETEERVPVIDIAGLYQDGEERQAVVEEIGRACSRWGFFQVINSGFDAELMERTYAEMAAFFQLPREEKMRVRRNEENSKGYLEKEFTKRKIDWKEVFDFGAQNGVVDGAGLDGTNQWLPDYKPSFRATMVEYFNKVYEISLLVFKAILDSLPGATNGVINTVSNADVIRQAFARHSSFCRLNHYPVCPTPEDALGVGAHTDSGALTVLSQSPVKSLQVQLRETGQWVDVEPIEGAFVINIGDIVQVISNDAYKATLHRVIARSDFERFSIPFFLNPDYEYTYYPLIPAEQLPLFKPINWGHFRLSRTAGDYADLGEEIQIDQYRITSN